jgi:hypothetical protein
MALTYTLIKLNERKEFYDDPHIEDHTMLGN